MATIVVMATSPIFLLSGDVADNARGLRFRSGSRNGFPIRTTPSSYFLGRTTCMGLGMTGWQPSARRPPITDAMRGHTDVVIYAVILAWHGRYLIRIIFHMGDALPTCGAEVKYRTEYPRYNGTLYMRWVLECSAFLVNMVTPKSSLQLSGSFGEAELSCGGEWLSQGGGRENWVCNNNGGVAQL